MVRLNLAIPVGRRSPQILEKSIYLLLVNKLVIADSGIERKRASCKQAETEYLTLEKKNPQKETRKNLTLLL